MRIIGYSNKTWACPFFQWDERMCVHCEGGSVAFPDKRARGEFIDSFCASAKGWEGCHLAGYLQSFYERSWENGTKRREEKGAGA